jgi:hypothetical protein
MDTKDLRASLDFGNTYADAARMLCGMRMKSARKRKSWGWSNDEKDGDGR